MTRLTADQLAEIREIVGDRRWPMISGEHCDALLAELAALQAELDEARADNTRLRDALETVARFHGAAWLEGTPAWAKDPLIAALAVSSPASGPADHDEDKP